MIQIIYNTLPGLRFLIKHTFTMLDIWMIKAINKRVQFQIYWVPNIFM
jgi:hypothetical protein